MTNRKHQKRTSKNDRAPNKKVQSPSPANLDPILQLQRRVGNRAVTKLIQRHRAEHLAEYAFRVKDLSSNEDTWLVTN